jgi:hypothetical protein
MTYDENQQISLLAVTERFIEERLWHSFKAFSPVLERPYQSTTELKAAVIEEIVNLKTPGRGTTPPSIKAYLRCLKAFLRCV